MKFKILASMYSESMEGWIWTNYNKPCTNGYILIKNPLNGKKVKCFKRMVDPNFLKRYNEDGKRCKINEGEDVIVMNEYYRNKLEITTKSEHELILKKICFLQYPFLNWSHPNPQVQFPNRATLIAMILAIPSLCQMLSPLKNLFCYLLRFF